MTDWLPDYKSGFSEELQGMVDRVGDTRLELGYLGRADGTSTIVNPSRMYNREMFYYGKVGGRPTPFGSARLAEDAGIYYEDSPENLDLPVWIVKRKGVRTIVQLVIPEALDQTGALAGLTPLEIKIANAGSSIVRNSTASTALAGDVGYITYDSTYGMVYLTTTGADLDAVPWCAVVKGGLTGEEIRVTRRGRMYLNYAGTAPTVGQFLATSTTPGSVVARTLMHPAVIAVAVEAGSGGKVLADLITDSQQFWVYSGQNFFNLVGPVSDTLWTGTINGAPSATNVPTTTATGALVNFGPQATTDLMKTRLRNITRGDYRLVTAVNAGTGAITTVSKADAWANTDNLTIESATCVSGLGNKFVDLDFGQFTTFPKMARAIVFTVFFRDTAAASQGFFFAHPRMTYNSLAQQGVSSIPGNLGTSVQISVPILDESFCWSIDATGATTASVFTRYNGYILAVPHD